MRVTQQEARRILEGRKTQHRFLVVEETRVTQRRRHAGGLRGPLVAVPSESPAVHRPFTPKVGGMLTVSAPGLPPTRVQITGFTREPLGAIAFRDVLAEGHRTTDEFKTWWIARHDREWAQREPDPHAWFEAAYGRPAADRRLQGLEDVIAGPLARFDTRWAGREVWAVTLQVQTTAGFLGIALDGHGDEHGYTTSPSETVPGIPQVVEPAVQERISAEGREVDQLRTAGVDEADVQALRRMRAQRSEYLRIATARGMNVRSELRMLDQAEASFLRKLRARTGRAAA